MELLQNKKTLGFPLVLIGKEYWRPLANFFSEMVAAARSIAPIWIYYC